MIKFISGKSLHLLSSWNGGDKLRLFQADLEEEGSFDEAIKGCDGVFHVAASMQFDIPHIDEHNLESYVQSKIIDPAIKGTLNLLNSCLKSKSVKRVVFTSSISTLTAKDSTGKWKPLVDESCQTTIGNVWETRTVGWVYVLSKLLTEQAAFRFAKENGIDLVSVITPTVAGPLLTSTVPSSIQVFLSPLTGDPKFFSILSAVSARMGSIALVHIDDICNAHIFLMEQPQAQGQYICCACTSLISDFTNHLTRDFYGQQNLHKLEEKSQNLSPPVISSKKLRDLGFNFKHGLQVIIGQTIEACLEHGFLPPITK
ncbi:putative anthocyanidin reductase isoform X3 [Carica papaya]|uniref:putative anthocyanidin reductase isoform X3 n=1 Tax=Carica papaya TaxID=3649 RepID=UPI000B8CCC3E|nr:putative anthocyanidin reductase isoform X3 [Carica papaya]